MEKNVKFTAHFLVLPTNNTVSARDFSVQRFCQQEIPLAVLLLKAF